jgi:hypothetical protein
MHPNIYIYTITGGELAIGHHIQIYMEMKSTDINKPDPIDASTSRSTSGIWREGQIIEYLEEEDMHRVKLDPLKPLKLSTQNIQNTPNSSSIEIVTISLDNVKHKWIDTIHGQMETAPRKDGVISNPYTITNQTHLSFSQRDVGLFLRVWWSRYERFFYGRVGMFDSSLGEHKITYEDGDFREYNMGSKIYELIELPLNFSLAGAVSDANCAQLVAAWHRKELIKIANNDNISKNDMIMVDDQIEDAVALRPQAALAYGASLHHLAVINAYFKAGGGNAMFQTLTDDSQPAPLCRIIALNLQLVYQMRKIVQPSVIKNLICEAKEGIPFAFNRYGDFQFKEFIRADFQAVTTVLRELILIATPQVLRLDETLEYLGLHVSSKLLTCSMLQKRYFGLAMINETIENILPIAATFVRNRSILLSNGNRKGGVGVNSGVRVPFVSASHDYALCF